LYTTIALYDTEAPDRKPCKHCHAERSEASHRVTMQNHRFLNEGSARCFAALNMTKNHIVSYVMLTAGKHLTAY